MKNSWLAAVALVLTMACGSDDPAPPDGTGGSGGGGGSGAGGGSGGTGAGSSTGCSDDQGDTGEFPCDVGPIIEAKCQRCHSEDCSSTDDTCVKAPFPLDTWADTREPYGGTPVYEHIGRVVKSGFMPLMKDDISPPVEPLTESEKTVLVDWAEGCAPPAAAACD